MRGERGARRLGSGTISIVSVVVAVMMAALPALAASGTPPAPPAPAEPRLSAHPATAKPVSPEDLHWDTANPTITGRIHPGCVEFVDPERTVSQGPITKIVIYHGGWVAGLRLVYGQTPGLTMGYTGKEEQQTEWRVPAGERITRVEGEVAGNYISALRFITDRGTESPRFGSARGTPFDVVDPARGELRTISLSANMTRSRAYNRAVASMTFRFGAPYFIKDIQYDESALENAKLNATPEVIATQDIENRSSVPQNSEYSRDLEIEKATKLTFEQSFGLSFGSKISASVGLEGMAKVEGESHWDVSVNASFSQEYSNTRREKVSWRVPVTVPPNRKIVATSTCRKFNVRIPFTYTIAWYEGSRDNIKKEVTLPGVYEDTRVEDLKHEFKEAPLD